jgi:two-component system, NtrC family, sensor histidine kinase PilS
MPMFGTKSRATVGDLPVVRWMLILRPAVVTATLGVAMLILPREAIDKFPIAVVVFGTYLLTLLYWMTQTISGISRSLLATQIAFDIFIITIIIHYTGGYDSSFVGFYFLSIMCAALFFRRLVTFLFSLQAILFYVAYLSFFTDVFRSPFVDASIRKGVILQAILYGILMLAVGFLSSHYSEGIARKDTALSSVLALLNRAKLDTSDILQSMNNGLIAFDMSGRVMYLNHAAGRILELKEVSVGERYDRFFDSRTEEFRKIIGRELKEDSPGADEEIEIVDRTNVPVPIGLTTIPLFDTDGSRRGIIVNFKDLTEKQKLVEMIRQSDRMAAIGELSAGIAHEIRNPLASICNAVEILSEEIGSRDERVSRLIEVIMKESDRLQRISSEFLKFARMKMPETQPVELRKVVEDVILLIDNDPRKTADVTIRNLIQKNPVVTFDPDHLRQLVINVIINSLDALDGKGTIEIRVERKTKTTDGFLRLVISDDGPGFPAGALKSVFEPFFSTKKDGTGLGLALVRKMAVSNHGRVLARNRTGGGAEIAFDIPLNGA